MKKTFITLLALAGVATATTTKFTDLSQDVTVGNLVWNSTDGTITATTGHAADLYDSVSAKGQSSLSFTLNLTQAATVTTDVALITIDSENDYGIKLKSTGISGFWPTKDNPIDDYNGRGSNNTLAEYSGIVAINDILTGNETVYTLGSDKLIALTLVIDRPCDNNSGNGNNVGLTLYDVNGERVWYCEALGASSNTSISSFKLNTDYITSAAVTPALLSASQAGSAAAALIPEPTTATLSLLALAGLAARRRRR